MGFKSVTAINDTVFRRQVGDREVRRGLMEHGQSPSFFLDDFFFCSDDEKKSAAGCASWPVASSQPSLAQSILSLVRAIIECTLELRNTTHT